MTQSWGMRAVSRGRKNPQSTKQHRREGSSPSGELVCGTDRMLTQRRYKHKKPHRTHSEVAAAICRATRSGPSVQWSLGWQTHIGAQKQATPRASPCLPCWPCPPSAPWACSSPTCQSHAGRATVSSSLSTSVHRSYETHLPITAHS